MPNARTAIAVHSPGLGVFTSLLLILFCLFKFERYQTSQLSDATVSPKVNEQVQKVPPCYNIPRLAGSQLVDEDPATVAADVPPPCTAYRFAMREFAATVTLQIRLHDKSMFGDDPPGSYNRPSRAFPKRSDEPSDSFSS